MALAGVLAAAILAAPVNVIDVGTGGALTLPAAPIKVSDSPSSAPAYRRAELASDSQGRIWVWAQRLNADATFTLAMAVSSDGGATFQAQPSLDTFADRPGGRILPVGGNRMML